MKWPLISRKQHEREIRLAAEMAAAGARFDAGYDVKRLQEEHAEAVRVLVDQHERDHAEFARRAQDVMRENLIRVRDECVRIAESAPDTQRPRFLKRSIAEAILRRFPLRSDRVHDATTTTHASSPEARTVKRVAEAMAPPEDPGHRPRDRREVPNLSRPSGILNDDDEEELAHDDGTIRRGRFGSVVGRWTE